MSRRLEDAVLEADLRNLHRAIDRLVLARIVLAVDDRRLEDDAHDADQRRRVVVGIEKLETHERVAHGRLVVVQHAHREIEVREPNRLVEDPHAAEIEHAEVRVVRHHVVAGMRIGVEDAELEELPPHHLEVLHRDPVLQALVDAGREDVAERIAVDGAHGQHTARREVRHRLGNHDLGIVGEELPEAREVRGLVHVVELLPQAILELARDLGRVDLLPHHVAADADERRDQRPDVLQILHHRLFDAGILDLHHDRVAVGQLGAVHLAERGRRERFGLERREELLRRRTELAGDLRADGGRVHRGHRRLHGRQHVERGRRQEIVPHAQHLHELHERALQLGGAFDDAGRVPHVRVEQAAVGLRLRLERALQRLPQVAAADRRGERADLERAPSAAGRERGAARPGRRPFARAGGFGRRRRALSHRSAG